MDDNTAVKLRPPALPAKIDEWTRYIEKTLTLNDLVENVHRVLWDTDPQYRAFLEAVYDEDAVEGSLAADNTMAAMRIREKAEAMTNTEVSKRKLATISKALGVVLRRYHTDRKRRRNTVAGQYVAPDDNNNGG